MLNIQQFEALLTQIANNIIECDPPAKVNEIHTFTVGFSSGLYLEIEVLILDKTEFEIISMQQITKQ